MNSSLFFGVLLFVMTVTNVMSLKCYVCDSCNDPFKESEGTRVTDACSGSCVKLKSGDNVVRACSPSSQGDHCEDADAGTGCSCTSDLCNNASGIGVSYFVVCLSSVVMILRMY